MSARRGQLLSVATELFLRHGFRRTSIEGLTHAAGISKGAFYLEFTTKEALFEELVRHELCSCFEDAADRVDADPQGGRLSRIYHHSVRALLDRDFLCALYTDTDGLLTGILRAHGAERYRPRVLLGADFIARMQEAELIRADADPDAISHALSTLMVGPLMAEPLLRTHDSPPLAETLDMLSTMVAASFEAPRGRSDAGKEAFGALVASMTEAMAPARGGAGRSEAPS